MKNTNELWDTGANLSCISEELVKLLGTDIISLGDFAISNFVNNTYFTFRIPSKESIDFTK